MKNQIIANVTKILKDSFNYDSIYNVVSSTLYGVDLKWSKTEKNAEGDEENNYEMSIVISEEGDINLTLWSENFGHIDATYTYRELEVGIWEDLLNTIKNVFYHYKYEKSKTIIENLTK